VWTHAAWKSLFQHGERQPVETHGCDLFFVSEYTPKETRK